MAFRDNSQIISFPSHREWQKWLSKNHATSKGMWLRFFKKGSGVESVTYDDALDDALCYGWIDGQLQKYDERSWLRKFTPRRPKSVWSKRNIGHVARLTKAGNMKPAGLREIESAKADGRWKRAYDSPSTMQIPKDFLKELSRNKRARVFFESLNKANAYAIAWRLHNAVKPDTRAKRMKMLLEMLANGKKFHV
jgi:uncharacterized protein YdeI (YjbR/CyaY-like superfamily)